MVNHIIIFCGSVHTSPNHNYQYLVEEKAIATSLKGEGAIGALVELVARVRVRVNLVPFYN